MASIERSEKFTMRSDGTLKSKKICKVYQPTVPMERMISKPIFRKNKNAYHFQICTLDNKNSFLFLVPKESIVGSNKKIKNPTRLSFQRNVSLVEKK